VPEYREFPIRDLPRELISQVHGKIRLHAVTMVVARGDGGEPLCCSGTLVTVNEIRGVLTARHVWELIQPSPTLALLVGGKPYFLKPEILRAFAPDQHENLEEVGASVPDIAFIRVPPPAAIDIEAYGKVFYSIDRRRETPDVASFTERGFWVLTGSPQALFDAATGMAPSFLYDTFVDKHVAVGAWDYLFMNLSLKQNPEIPINYGGMSGGGIWRAAFWMSPDEAVFAVEDPQRDIVLSGVAFFQTGLDGRQIIGHGPRSLYETFTNEHIHEVT
jgi:hypothetical protein